MNAYESIKECREYWKQFDPANEELDPSFIKWTMYYLCGAVLRLGDIFHLGKA